jgi:hypothetical protein
MANDRAALAERLYSRLPEIYRTRDLAVAREALPSADDTVVLNARPLLALVSAIATQVASVRQDMDDLWDNFFIETADDWVVPYIGALLGTRLLPNEVEQSKRLDVRNTVLWRRSKGTPAMLAAVVSATTGWPCEVAEFFSSELWVENLRHLRLARPFTASLRDRFALSRLGHADDPFLHSPDVRVPADPAWSPSLAGLAGGREATDEEPLTGGLGRSSVGTGGRYGLKNLGVFVRRLPTFRVSGVTPVPDLDENPDPDPATVTTYSFDPLGRDVPLFCAATGAPIERAQLDHQPDQYFGSTDTMDVSVRRLGIPAAIAAAASTPTRETSPFKFAGNADLHLHPAQGLRLLQPRAFGLAGQSFIVSAIWRPMDRSKDDLPLGGVSTLLTRLGRLDEAFRAAAGGPALDGQLVIRIEVADPSMGWPQLPAGREARFPETVLAVRDDVTFPRAVLGGVESRYQDSVLVYLPAVLVAPDHPVELWVAADGATYWQSDMTTRANLARPSEGQIWPAADLSRPSLTPAPLAPGIHRRRGLAIADPSRFDPAKPVLVEVGIMTASSEPQMEGGLLTVGAAAPPTRDYPGESWKAFEYHASTDAIGDRTPQTGLRVIQVTPQVPSSFCPQFEVVMTDRAGNSLLCYLPETTVPQQQYYIHDDGSSYLKPGPADPQQRLARIGAGQALPIEGVFPLSRRTVCSGRRPASGELAIDPERGLFAFAADDPIVKDQPLDSRELTVDYVEAFSDQVGARAFSRGVDYVTDPPTRIVAASGDAATYLPLARIHTTLQDAINHATDGEVIEIADSATYLESCTVTMSSDLQTLTIRAADQPLFTRPCLRTPSGAAIAVLGSPAKRLELSGLLISGGPMQIQNALPELLVTACTFEVQSPGAVSIAAGDEEADNRARFVICRSLLGAILTGQGIDRLLVADSVVDNRNGLAIGGLIGDSSGGDAPARSVQLERVTVLGRVRCDSLVASESILADAAFVDDRQSGCLRFSRFEAVSANHLPRRFRCVTDRPIFASLIQWRPAYVQLASTTPAVVLTASETGDAVGSFASTHAGARLANLKAKLLEFLPVGLSPVVVVEA